MDLAPDDLHHRLEQLRFLAAETTDSLAERLVQDLIVELEDEFAAASEARASPGNRQGAS